MTTDERVDLYSDAIHDISVLLRETGGTPSQKSRTLKGIEGLLLLLYAQLELPVIEEAA